MKTIKLFLLATSVCLSPLFVNAQTLNDAIKQTTNEQFEKADASFKSLIQADPNKGEYYFYLGENYFNNNNIDLATKTYQKGADVNATNPLPYVGLGKILWYQGKQAEAKESFFKAKTLAKTFKYDIGGTSVSLTFTIGKNSESTKAKYKINSEATVLMKIADAYINADTKDIAEALTLLDQAVKLEPYNPEIYISRGDAYLEQNNGSEAIKNYEMASNMDNGFVKAVLRQGQLYSRAKNYNLALDLYKKASLIDSSFAPAYREKAEIYLRAGQFANAAYNAKRYLQLNNDCSAKSQYSGILNQAKQYKESIEAGKEALKCEPINPYTYRYLAFSQFEVADYVGGLENSNNYFAKAPADKIIPMDYEYRAKLLSKTGKDSLAIIDYKKALQLQPDKIELNADIANAYIKMKKYSEAIASYKIKMEKGKTNANDYFGLTRAYYYSKDFVNADSSAVQIIKSQPDLGLGYLWRAKVNVQTDAGNKNWAAKPYYELYISKIKPEDKEKNKKDLIDSYNYLAAYYAEKKDCPNVKLYMQKVLELDATNAQAAKVIAGLKC